MLKAGWDLAAPKQHAEEQLLVGSFALWGSLAPTVVPADVLQQASPVKWDQVGQVELLLRSCSSSCKGPAGDLCPGLRDGSSFGELHQ